MLHFETLKHFFKSIFMLTRLWHSKHTVKSLTRRNFLCFFSLLWLPSIMSRVFYLHFCCADHELFEEVVLSLHLFGLLLFNLSTGYRDLLLVAYTVLSRSYPQRTIAIIELLPQQTLSLPLKQCKILGLLLY